MPDANLFAHGPSLEARSLYARGLASFHRRDFSVAREHFRQALDLHPEYREAELYLCLVTLSMRAPTMLTPLAADQLNEQLDRLVRSQNKSVSQLASLALAVLRLDYYEQKQIKSKGIPTEELFRALKNTYPSRKQREALAAVTRSTRAALRFRLNP